MMVACNSGQKTERYTIASQTADCTGVGPQKCMLVKKGNATDWEYFYSRIEGFNYEEGFEYELDVREIPVENPPADASSIRYELVNVISKTSKTSENLPPDVTVQKMYQWGGKVLNIEEQTIGRGAAEGRFPVTVLTIEVSHTSTDLFQPRDTIHAEVNRDSAVTPVIGREYVFKSTGSHPAHASGIYMLDTKVMDLV